MGLIDSSVLDGLGFLFNKRVTIQEEGAGRDSFGGEDGGWADKAGHVDIPCVISPAGSSEVGGEVNMLDPYGVQTAPERDTYIKNMRYNTNKLAQGFSRP